MIKLFVEMTFPNCCLIINRLGVYFLIAEESYLNKQQTLIYIEHDLYAILYIKLIDDTFKNNINSFGYEKNYYIFKHIMYCVVQYVILYFCRCNIILYKKISYVVTHQHVTIEVKLT